MEVGVVAWHCDVAMPALLTLDDVQCPSMTSLEEVEESPAAWPGPGFRETFPVGPECCWAESGEEKVPSLKPLQLRDDPLLLPALVDSERGASGKREGPVIPGGGGSCP